MTFLAGTCILVMGIYSLTIFFLALGLLSIPRHQVPLKKGGTKVSVLVPFRNELGVLPALIQDLKAQRYPSSDFEVILVNDHSTDDSPQMVKEGIAGLEHFRCLDLPPEKSGKKAALEWGVDAAKHQWILQTDADGRLGKDFLSAHVTARMEGQADLVAGWVIPQQAGSSFLSSFEALDVMALAGTGAASFAWGRPLMCSGANLAYSKDLYQETRVLDPAGKVASGDDMFLMIAARKRKKKMVFLPSIEAMVHTRGVDDWKEWFWQRVRWGGKAVYYSMADIQATAFLVVLAALCTLALPFLMLAHPALWHWLAGIMALKMLVDFLLLYLVTTCTNRRHSLRHFLPAWLVYQPFLLLSAIASLLLKPNWEGRVR